jgi:predicted ArsR family transcriptional regulator
MDPDPLDDHAPGLAALAEPLRRQLYRYVARSPAAVGREEAAEALGVAVHTAKFHLDRMVESGLLAVDYKRLSGRSGPGAGRPAKLYRRAEREFTVSLPQRHYDLLSDILAEAAEGSIERRIPVDEVAPEVARRQGEAFGAQRSTKRAPDRPSAGPLDRLACAHEEVGYEPRVDDERMVLENCPFDRVAQEHTELVCGLNLDFVSGVASGLGCHDVTATLEPAPGRCCVSARRDTGSA